MTIQQIKYVIGIAETDSFNRAAEKLYVSQPSLTSTIHDLENELGITIFNRSGHGVTLTNDGHEFVSNARQVYLSFLNLAEKYGENSDIKKKFGVSTQHYRTIKANDRASMLNLMIGLNGYTLCSGIICKELNGSDFIAVPFRDEDDKINRIMQIGYITKKNFTLSTIGEKY